MFHRLLTSIALLGLATSCGSYKQNIMFRVPERSSSNQIEANLSKTEYNYIIKKNDYLSLHIYTNNGERMIDPNPELSQSQNNNYNQQAEMLYLVNLDGLVKFPLIGELKVEGLTLRQAEQIAQKEFEFYYKLPFVQLKVKNKRVIVLGEPGGLVIPMENENMTLVEVLALAKGISNNGKANNIRVLRGEHVFLIDLSSIEGYKNGNIIIDPGDVIYVEPVRKPLAEGFRDYSILLTFLVSATTLVTILTR